MKTTLQEYLENAIKITCITSIKADVIKSALNCDDIELFFTNLARFGCLLEIVNHLGTYQDTYKYFDQHYVEIDTLRTKHEIYLPFNENLKDFLVRRIFEVVAQQLYQDWKATSLLSMLFLIT